MLSYAQSFNSPRLDSDHYPKFKEKDKRTSTSNQGPAVPPKPLPRISAVVVFHTDAHLRDCLLSLKKAATRLNEDVEVIVVENGARSTLWEETADLWDSWADMATNIGVSAARNLGAQMARGDLLAFIDDDGQVDPDFFRAALPYFSDHNVLGIRGRVVARHHPYFSSLAGHYDRGDQPLDDALITEGASIIRRTPFLDVNGFPTDLYGHEGIALTYRLQQYEENARTLYAPNVRLYHDYVESWPEFIEKSIRCARNEAHFHDQNIKSFLDHYFQSPFPSPPRPLREKVARITLKALRGGIQHATRIHTRSHSKMSALLRQRRSEQQEHR